MTISTMSKEVAESADHIRILYYGFRLVIFWWERVRFLPTDDLFANFCDFLMYQGVHPHFDILRGTRWNSPSEVDFALVFGD